MGTTGLIFAAIAVAWLAYLVPLYLRRRDEAANVDEPVEHFSSSMRLIKYGTAPLLDQDLAEIKSVEISTPMTRRAAIADLRRLDKLAAKRRRRVLVALLAALSGVLGACVAELIPWWSLAIPAAVLIGFLILARFSVRAMRRDLDARFEAIAQGNNESTVFLSRVEVTRYQAALESAQLVEEKPKPGALWDPIPVTLPTYVSKPLAPRTVRTIDLSGPDVTSSARSSVPVTADALPSEEVTEVFEGPVVEQLPKAAGA